MNNKWFVGEEIGVYYDWVYDGIWKTEEAEEAAKYGRKPGQIKVKSLVCTGIAFICKSKPYPDVLPTLAYVET